MFITIQYHLKKGRLVLPFQSFSSIFVSSLIMKISLFILICLALLQLAKASDSFECRGLDNGQTSNNPVYKNPECSYQCNICETEDCKDDDDSSCSSSVCSEHENDGSINSCKIDGYVGSYVILENESIRIWNFTLEPGQMTSMHRHDFDYSFIAVRPSQLEVFGEDGKRLFEFWATESSLKINGDYLEPIDTDIKLPWKVPRVHAARNIGTNTYHEILFEHKYGVKDSTDFKAINQEL